MTTVARLVGAAVALAVISVVWSLGGVAAIACLLLLALATVSGLPLGFLLFGRHHAAGWIAGLLLGYGLTGLAIWAVAFWIAESLSLFVGGWALLSGATWFAARRVSRRIPVPLVTLPCWSAKDTAALQLVLVLVPILVGPPFANIGATDAAGNRLYRAYFTADFVWHTALVAEMTKPSHPPRNPYLASQPIHYYWTYFLIPSAIAGQTAIRNVELVLQVNAAYTALLFVAAIYLVAWTALSTYPFAVAVALLLTMLAASVEGLAAVVDLLRRGRSLAELRELNIDAVSAWAFGGLRIDNLPRSMWYTPQHAAAYALGLIAIPVATDAGVRARRSAILLAGLALGLSVTFNPLVGGLLCAIYGLAVVGDAIRARTALRDVIRHAFAIVPLVAALAWCALNEVAEGAGGALRFGLLGPARNDPVIAFLLSFGPILLPIGIGLWKGNAVPFWRVWPAFAGVVLAVLVMHLVTLDVDLFWIGFRAGQLFLVMAPALVARGLIRLWQPGLKLAAVGVALAVLALGLPTTVIDAYNAQDVDNRLMGPGFRWTVVLTPAQQEALAWIRAHTAADAIVQADPTVRGRETWSLIPSFAERRMAAGLPISLLHVPEYDETSQKVRQVYASTDATEAWRIAKDLGIDYLYVDATERAAYPNVSKFDAHPEHFQPAFKNSEVTVYTVR